MRTPVVPVAFASLASLASGLLLGCETLPPILPEPPGPTVSVSEGARAALTPTLDEAAVDDVALPDASLRAAVEGRLRAESAVGIDVEVQVDEGVVILSGTAPDLLTKDRLVAEAAGVRGVRGIVDRLEVEPPSRSDEAIARDVRRALEASTGLEGVDLSVRVQNGYVTLEGALKQPAEATHAMELARGVVGVRDVVDRTSVTPRDEAGDEDIRASLERALALDARFRGNPIGVEVEGGIARLTGAVDSAEERELAADYALAAGADFVDIRELSVGEREDDAPRPGGVVRDDGLIEDAVRAALSLDPRLDDEAVRVEVRDGVATLRGSVRTLAAREAATERAQQANGVRGVRNLVDVEPALEVPDEELLTRVDEALSRDPWLFDADLNVRVEDGFVTLSGELPSRYVRERARALVSSIEGVDEVRAEGLELTSPEPLSDEELRAAVLEQLFWNPNVDTGSITVRVEGGVVWLSGEARDLSAASSARESAFLAGAKSVVNEIEVPSDPPDIRTVPQAERGYLEPNRDPFFFSTPFESGDR